MAGEDPFDHQTRPKGWAPGDIPNSTVDTPKTAGDASHGGQRPTRSPNVAKMMGPGRYNSTVHTPKTAGDASLGGRRPTRSPNLAIMMVPGDITQTAKCPRQPETPHSADKDPLDHQSWPYGWAPTLGGQRPMRPPNLAIRMGPGRCISTNNTPRLPLRSQGNKTAEIRFDTAGATTCTSKKRSENAGLRKIFRLNNTRLQPALPTYTAEIAMTVLFG